MAWIRLAMARSDGGIFAIASSTAVSSFAPRASAFRSRAYALAAARSSAVKLVDVFPAAVVLFFADFCAIFLGLIVPPVRLAAIGRRGRGRRRVALDVDAALHL